jgi:hypothetical protein
VNPSHNPVSRRDTADDDDDDNDDDDEGVGPAGVDETLAGRM